MDSVQPHLRHPQQGATKRLHMNLHKVLLYFIPFLLTFRLMFLSAIHWQEQLIYLDPTSLKLKNCSCTQLQATTTKQLSPNSTKPSEMNDGKVIGRSRDDARSSLNSILSSIHVENSKFLNGPSGPIKPRAFPRRKSSFPCYAPEKDWIMYDTVQREPARKGFFYVKTYKTASTTVMGVSIRIALKSAERRKSAKFKPCKVRFEHWPAYRLRYRERIRAQSFLFAVLREPTERAISMFFHFDVSRDNIQPLDSNFIHFLTANYTPDVDYPGYYPWAVSFDHYLHYLSVDGYEPGSERGTPKRRVKTVNKILKDYDFIGVTERLDESLVALQMILGLKTSDILYYSAKGNGSWDDKGVYIQPSFVSQGMRKFFASNTWKELSRGDYLMYLAANASLDRTIDSLGRERFEQKLSRFRYAKNLVMTNCTNIIPLFSSEGQAWDNDCLLADAGCGSSCFDRLERDFML